ncbi:MAG: VOC family protein [Pseudomonadales bacterium]
MSLEIVIDAKTPSELARFWAAAIPAYQVRPYDEKEIARLASLGLTPKTDTSVAIDSPGGPTLWFQKSESKTRVRNRIHFDLKFDERQVEVSRLKKLGATVKIERSDHVVMLDPEGNQFCLFDP